MGNRSQAIIRLVLFLPAFIYITILELIIVFGTFIDLFVQIVFNKDQYDDQSGLVKVRNKTFNWLFWGDSEGRF